MKELVVRKDGSSAIENANGIGINPVEVGRIVGEHLNLRADGFRTAQVSSGAVLEGKRAIVTVGGEPTDYSYKTQAMFGMAAHFMVWTVEAGKHGLLVASSLSTAIELRHSKEGKEIRGGMGSAIKHDNVLLVGNYHDEADSTEMRRYTKQFKKLIKQGKVLHTESEENDFHAANIAIATGAKYLLLCTSVDGFYKGGKRQVTINVEDIDKALRYCEERSTNGKGGMKTKLKAARWAARHGIIVIIGDTREDARCLIEDHAGTWVLQ